MKIVLTMTSWVKRINHVAKSIYRFLQTQTIKPDYCYLWLAEEEFPNRENDLPHELLLVCEALNVRICWTKYNEYAFKRWYVYPKHNDDLVISIDDDNAISIFFLKSLNSFIIKYISSALTTAIESSLLLIFNSTHFEISLFFS